MWLSSMKPTRTLSSGIGLFMALISGMAICWSRWACDASIGRVETEGRDADGVEEPVLEGEAEGELTLAQPMRRPTSVQGRASRGHLSTITTRPRSRPR